jgi:hypothetical protein
MTRRPDGWQGTEFSDLQTVQNLLETLLNSGIPIEKHHYNEVILSNKMRPTTNQHIQTKEACPPIIIAASPVTSDPNVHNSKLKRRRLRGSCLLRPHQVLYLQQDIRLHGINRNNSSLF